MALLMSRYKTQKVLHSRISRLLASWMPKHNPFMSSYLQPECIRYDDIDGKRVPTHSFKVELSYHSLLPPLLHGKDLHKPDTRDSKVSK